MQTIALINQKGRVGKTSYKRLTNNLKLFFEKRRIFKDLSYREYRKNLLLQQNTTQNMLIQKHKKII